MIEKLGMFWYIKRGSHEYFMFHVNLRKLGNSVFTLSQLKEVNVVNTICYE